VVARTTTPAGMSGDDYRRPLRGNGNGENNTSQYYASDSPHTHTHDCCYDWPCYG